MNRRDAVILQDMSDEDADRIRNEVSRAYRQCPEMSTQGSKVMCSRACAKYDRENERCYALSLIGGMVVGSNEDEEEERGPVPCTICRDSGSEVKDATMAMAVYTLGEGHNLGPQMADIYLCQKHYRLLIRLIDIVADTDPEIVREFITSNSE